MGAASHSDKKELENGPKIKFCVYTIHAHMLACILFVCTLLNVIIMYAVMGFQKKGGWVCFIQFVLEFFYLNFAKPLSGSANLEKSVSGSSLFMACSLRWKRSNARTRIVLSPVSV